MFKNPVTRVTRVTPSKKETAVFFIENRRFLMKKTAVCILKYALLLCLIKVYPRTARCG